MSPLRGIPRLPRRPGPTPLPSLRIQHQQAPDVPPVRQPRPRLHRHRHSAHRAGDALPIPRGSHLPLGQGHRLRPGWARRGPSQAPVRRDRHPGRHPDGRPGPPPSPGHPRWCHERRRRHQLPRLSRRRASLPGVDPGGWSGRPGPGWRAGHRPDLQPRALRHPRRRRPRL